MKFTSLQNNQLLATLKQKSFEERKLTLEIIELLEEVDRRSLHLQMGYGSLIHFCTQELHYSESEGYRRISAMRVTKELPQVKKSIEAGTLNLTTVTQAQTFFRQEKKYQGKKYSKAEKLSVLQSLENKSKKEAEKILLQKSPDLPKVEIVKAISATQTRVTLTLDDGLLQKLDDLKSKYSHINVNPSYAELIELMASELLRIKNKTGLSKDKAKTESEEQRNSSDTSTVQREATAPAQKSIQQSVSEDIAAQSDSTSDSAIVDSSCLGRKAQSPSNETPHPEQKRSRFIPASIRRLVFQRDQGCCSYRNPGTHHQCGSKFQLEIDHVLAFSCGGSNRLENLRLVCRNHNQYNWRFVQS